MLDIVCISSHCGLEQNDEVHELVKGAASISIDKQCPVPNTYEDFKATICKPSRSIKIAIPKLPNTLADLITPRRAEFILNQLYTEVSPIFYPLAKLLKITSGRCGNCSALLSLPWSGPFTTDVLHTSENRGKKELHQTHWKCWSIKLV